MGLLSSLTLAQMVIAQEPQPLFFRHYSTGSGLAHSNVLDVHLDQKGFLWIGTERGLSRFDGHRFKNFYNDPTDSTGIYDHFVLNLAEDSKGTIWIVARAALMAFDPKLERFETYLTNPRDSSLMGFGIADVLVDHHDRVWLATNGAGLSRLNPETGTWTRYRHVVGDSTMLSTNDLHRIQMDQLGLLWIGLGDEGLARLDPESGKIEIYRHDPADASTIPPGVVVPLLTDSEGRMWFGSESGIFRFDSDTSSFVEFGIVLEGKPLPIWDGYKGRDGSFWLIADQHGIVSYDPASGAYIVHVNDPSDQASLSHNNVRSLLEDRTGGLWVATLGGLSMADLTRKPFLNYDKRKRLDDSYSLYSAEVFGLAEDRSTGDIWVATINGLHRQDVETGQFSIYLHDEKDSSSLPGNEVWMVYGDARGVIWSSSYGLGLDRWNPETKSFTHYVHDASDSSSFAGATAFIMYEDSRLNLWVGTDFGLNRYDPQTDSFSLYSPPDGRHVVVRAIHEDTQGIVWVGTAENGLLYLDPDSHKLLPFMSPDSTGHFLRNVHVSTLFVDSFGDMWIGTDKGLHRRPGGTDGSSAETLESYYEQDGLSDNGVVGILEDDSGRLWITTSSGLTRMTRNLDAEGADADFRFRIFDVSDGLPSNTFYIGPTLKSQDGRFYLGTNLGFTTFYPREIRDNPFVPQVVISEFNLFNERIPTGATDETGRIVLPLSVPYLDELELSHSDRVFSIDFTALHFAAPEKNTYAYKLEGFEQEWNLVQNKQQATYTNLSPGIYTFRVKAANLDGVWSEKDASLAIVVRPPFWATGWFRFLALCTIGLTIGAFYRSKTNAMRRHNQELEQRVAQRTEEIRHKSNALEGANEELQAINRSLQETNQRLEERTEELRDTLEQNKEILGVTVHDLKNPLGGMIGLIDVTLQDSFSMDDESYRMESTTNLDMIKVEAERMLKSIEGLLDRYRSNREAPLRLEEVNLCDIISTVLRWNQKQARDKDIGIHFDWVDDAVVVADESAVQRIIDNLVSNAIKYNRIGGSVSILLECRDMGVFVSITDEGQGLTDEDKQKAFGKLQRLSAKPTAGEHSTGLGLHIVKQLVEMHEGRVGVESEAGNGATFWFELPAVPRQEPVSIEAYEIA